MNKLKIFIISFVSSIFVSSTVSATLVDNSKYNFNEQTNLTETFGFIAYDTATLNADVRGSVYAKNIEKVENLSGTLNEPLYYSCESKKQANSDGHHENSDVTYLKFDNNQLEENKKQIKKEIATILKTKTVLKYNKLIENDKLNVNLTNGDTVYIEILEDDVLTSNYHLYINGSQPSDFSNLYKNIILIYQGKGILDIGVDCIGGTLLAPDADVVLNGGCGNYDGTVFANNITTNCEIHQVLPNIPATIGITPETSSSENTPPEEDSTTVVTEESSNVVSGSEQPGKGGGDDNYADAEIDKALNELDSSSIASDQSSTIPYQFSAQIAPTKQPIPETTNPYTGNFLKTFIPTFIIVLIGLTFILKKVINKNSLQ